MIRTVPSIPPTFKGAYIPAHSLPYDSKTGFVKLDLIVTGEDAAKNQKTVSQNGETSLLIKENRGKTPSIYYRNGWNAKETLVTNQDEFDLAKQLYELAARTKTVPDRDKEDQFSAVLKKISHALLDFGAANNFKI